MLAFITLLGVSVPVLADQPGSDTMKQDHEKGGTERRRIRGKARMEMYQQMQEMQNHSKMMEGITDQQQLMQEMKKHIRMADTMMQRMLLLLHRGVVRPQQESEYQDHDSGMEEKLKDYYQRITRPQQGSESRKLDSGTGQSVMPQASPEEHTQPSR
jgi:hypothetical protein